MGQSIGKALIHEDAIPFINLPKSLVERLGQSVFEVAEGFGLDKEELKKIISISLLSDAAPNRALSDTTIDECSEKLFALFGAGAPENQGEILIDSFEFLAAICILSGMLTDEKSSFLFSLFDFNESGSLNINEATLAFRALAYGTAKILAAPTSLEVDVDVIDKIALEAFEVCMPHNLKFSQAMAVVDHSLNREEFLDYISNCAETTSFINHFDDIRTNEPLKSNEAIENESLKLRPLKFPVAVDKSASNEPWRDKLRLLPRSFEEVIPEKSPPSDGLTLDWILGRNGRTPVYCCSNGDVIFAAGSLLVKVSSDESGDAAQEYFSGHSCHVTSIDVFDDKVASGDAGNDSKICVWSSNSLSLIVVMPCCHQHGTSKLHFSPSGDLLLSLGNNNLNTVAIHKWHEKTVIFTCKVGADVFDCGFLATDDDFGVCTEDSVFFWNRMKPSTPYRKRRGVFNLLSTREVMTAIACTGGGTVVTGSLLGRLWIWEGRVCTKVVDALRSGPITQLHAPRNNAASSPEGLCVATHGGSVHILNGTLDNHRRLVPNKRFDDSERIVDAVCWHPATSSILVGQNESDIYKMSACNEHDVTTVTSGRFEAGGICMRNGSIVTVGRDKVKVWRATRRDVQRETSIEDAAHSISCISYNPQVDELAIGFGGDKARSSSAHSFLILNGKDLQIVHRGCNTVDPLSICKYSRDGKLLAFGSVDACIYIHSALRGIGKNTEGYPLLAKARGHSSPIRTLDFGCEVGSENATALRTNSTSGEAMFWTTRGKVQTPLSQRDTVWESHSSIYTACLEGVHDSYSNSKNGRITSCFPFFSRSIVVGDSNGSLRVYSYPVASSNQLSLESRGHSGPVQSIQTDASDKFVFTMGGRDRCLFQWKHTVLNWDQGLPTAPLRSKPQHPVPNESFDMQTMIDQMEELGDTRKCIERNEIALKPKPWTRSIVAPAHFVPNDGRHGHSQLILERIHGYSGKGVKNNLHCLRGGDCIVYAVGKTCVKYDAEQDMQQFYIAAGRATCLAVHQGNDASYCAIGQDGSSLIIVDLDTMREVSFLHGHASPVICIDFDDGGNFVVSISDSQQVVVHDWKNNITVASARSYGETLDVKFLEGSSNSFVECGACFVRFWRIKGCALFFEEVDMDSVQHHIQYYSCLGWNGKELVVGTSSGDLIQFVDNKPKHRRIKAHQSVINNISSREGGGFSSSSSDDVKLWSSSMRCELSINTEALSRHDISGLCLTESMIFVGTTGCEIWQLNSDDGSNCYKDKALLSSHSSSPMGISVHPLGKIATCDDDGFLRVWDSNDHAEARVIDLGMPARACAFSPDAKGRMIAVGFGKPVKDSARTINGKWAIIKLADDGEFQIIAERRDARQYVNEMKWHGNGDRLAVGSWDKKICVYGLVAETKPAVSVEITLLSMIELTSPPVHFDFSRDGKYLRANCSSFELHFFEAGPGLHIKEPSRLKDTPFETDTCIFGWNVQGVWLKEDRAEITSLDCNAEHSTVASGDSWGNLRTHHFPCSFKGAQYTRHPAHQGPVGKVRWVPGGGCLVSTGEEDNSVFLWRHIIEEDNGNAVVPEESMEESCSSGVDEVACPVALYDFAGQIVYPALGNCIVFDRSKCCQVPQDSFQHEATVSAICASHSRRWIASSDARVVRLWDSHTCTGLATLSDAHQEQISALSFSSDGASLVSVSSDGRQYVICVWATLTEDWNDARLVLHTLAGREKVHFCHFAAFSAGYRLVSGGSRHVHFWSERNRTLVLSRGLLTPQLSYDSDTFLCAVAVEEGIITGTKSGSLLVWDDRTIAKELQAHNDAVSALRRCPEGILSGCASGAVSLWSSDLKRIASYDVAQPVISIDVTIHSNGGSTTKVLCRTRAGEIYEISKVTGVVTCLLHPEGTQTNEQSGHSVRPLDCE